MTIRYNGRKVSNYKQLEKIMHYEHFKHDFSYYDALSATYEVL